jgi:Glu-tRNA(Gln) amidotransferase subunit E-like FAD-binding protein
VSRRINVIVSDTLNEKLDKYSEKYGVSKSMICSFVVGQWVDQMEKVNNTMYGATGKDGFLAEVFKDVIRNELK